MVQALQKVQGTVDLKIWHYFRMRDLDIPGQANLLGR